MTGCLRNAFAGLGVVATLAAAGFGVWHFRERIDKAYHAIGRDQPAADATNSEVGYYSPKDLETALAKERSIAGNGGPDHVVLSAAEMASVVRDRLDPGARLVLDSIGVRLRRDTLTLVAVLLTGPFGGDLLGPLRGILNPREPLKLSGVAEIREPGVISWSIDEFMVSSFPFPQAAVPLLVKHLTGSPDGVILMTVPPSVLDLTVRPAGITFSRRDN